MKTFHLANLSFLSKALCCEFCGENIEISNQFRKTYDNYFEYFPTNSKHRASFIHESLAK